jgi:type IV pilus biogenesis protein PilP
MKPSFALDLRSNVVTLLHRTARGWTKVGEASLDAPDLAEAMAFMRSTALGLSPRGITTKLILPNEQILYTKVTAPVAEPWTRTRRIGAALEGLTPYRLDELSYDWCETGTGLQVAVLAKETLEEAETFAREHRFNPVSFVAVPEPGTYLGEPFFGPSKLSKSLLAKDETVERDSEAVRVVGRDVKAKPNTAATAAAQAKAPVQDTAPDTTAPPSVQPEATEVLPPSANTTAPSLTPIAADDPAVTADDAPVAGEKAPVAQAEKGQIPPHAEAIAAPITDPAVAEAVLADAPENDPAKGESFKPLPAPSPEPQGDAPPSVPAQQEAALAPDDAAAPQPNVDVPEAPMVVDVDPEDADLPLAAEDPKPATTAKKAQPALSATASAKGKTPRDASLRAVGPAPTARGPVARPAAAKPLPKTTVVARPSAARPWQARPVAEAKDSASGATGFVAARAALGRITSAKGPVTPTQRRYVIVILAAVLLALLVIVAIWSSLSLGTNEAEAPSAPPAPVVAQETAQESTAPENTATQTPTPLSTATALPSAQDAAPADDPVIDTADAALATTATPGTAQSSDVAAEGAGTPSPATATAGKGETLFASADTPPIRRDPIGLPALQGGADSPPAIPPTPPPYSANTAPESPPSSLIPTPEGVVTPQGVLLIAGPPPTVPPARPKDLMPIAPLDPAVAAPSETVADARLVQDPTLAGIRPRARPADLVTYSAVPSAPEVLTLSSLAPDSPFANLRPQARPADLIPKAPEVEAPLPDGAVVAISPTPPARPADIDTGIDDAVSVALNQDVAAVQPTGEPEPEPQPEVQAEAPAPTLPTNASVAKQATEKNAMSAKKVVLLGVFGTPTSRYAMIRLPSGRVKKVKVGDTVDGGRIAAITADSVKYQKGNRIITLTL